MFFKSKWFQLIIALIIGVIILLLPRPEGTKFKITGDTAQNLFTAVQAHFDLIIKENPSTDTYVLVGKNPEGTECAAEFLQQKAADLGLPHVQVDYVDGLSPRAKRFLAVLCTLIILFILEPIPLEITAICIGVFLVAMNVTDVKTAWAPYMHPVVVFIMCCLIFAVSLDKAV